MNPKGLFFNQQEWWAIILVACCQTATAWLMALFDLIYAPIPMFAAALLAGFLFRGRPRQASVGAALAGLFGGTLAEWIFHIVRMKKIMSWYQLSSAEQFALSFAEMLLYTSLLSFFAAFLSWGVYKEPRPQTSVNKKSDSHAYLSADNQDLKVELPLFKEDRPNVPETKSRREPSSPTTDRPSNAPPPKVDEDPPSEGKDLGAKPGR